MKELLNKRVQVTTKHGLYAGKLVRVGKTHICVNELLILHKDGKLKAASKRDTSRKFPLSNIVKVEPDPIEFHLVIEEKS